MSATEFEHVDPVTTFSPEAQTYIRALRAEAFEYRGRLMALQNASEELNERWHDSHKEKGRPSL